MMPPVTASSRRDESGGPAAINHVSAQGRLAATIGELPTVVLDELGRGLELAVTDAFLQSTQTTHGGRVAVAGGAYAV